MNSPQLKEVCLTILFQVSVADKIELSSPFRFFLSNIAAVGDTGSQALTLKFADTLDPSLGNLQESVQINFMVELGSISSGLVLIQTAAPIGWPSKP